MDLNTSRTRRAPLRTVDHMVSYLVRAAGVRHMFGVHGANIEDLYDAASGSGLPISAVIAKHEFAAGTMADGYHRTGNRIAVVTATSGGGALNLVAALGEAYASEVPVLALVGQPPTALEGRGAFQDQSGVSGSIDCRAVFSPVSRFCERVGKPEDVAHLLPAALAAAVGSPAGPAVLLLPKDIQQATLSTPDWDEPAVTSRTAGVSGTLRWRLRTGRVVIIAGSGVIRANARAELAALAEALDAGVAVEADAKDAFDNHSHRFLGVAGTMGHPSVRRALLAATSCVLAGTRLPHGSRLGLEDLLATRELVAFHDQPPYVHDERALLVDGDLRANLLATTTMLGGRDTAAPSEVARGTTERQRAEVDHLPLPERSGDQLGCREVLEVISAVLPVDANVVSDAGNAGAAVVHFLPTPRRGRQVLAMGMGGMGFSFGAGLGAAFATGKRTYVLAGDGSFFMHGMEVHTAVEYHLPVTFVVFNNNAHAMCVTREDLYYPGVPSHNRFTPTSIGAGVDAMFPSLAVHTVRARTGLDACRDFLLDAESRGGPTLVCVELDTDEIPPFLPFLRHEAVREAS
ncbi:thiamine pyrophosphate-binding protein [Actinophytocola gossypii]|uniref:Thiamine pyrophosphate-binding protein n=1 Tax=Actinophytocola gossypii TaxID=2812003 RepID=A0ABT2J769_9PSEU|nr:thiamine pyrophosphate-binding protein [Actinophytocola gossypii]MCT2583119.1 thiamine pyrophosphate-binding protein [Actinophytocola gossypii]